MLFSFVPLGNLMYLVAVFDSRQTEGLICFVGFEWACCDTLVEDFCTKFNYKNPTQQQFNPNITNFFI